MNYFKTPTWFKEFNYHYNSVDEIPISLYKSINDDLDKVQSSEPVVTIVISAWNEEINILRCIGALSRMKNSVPFEIVAINNNSTDRTQEVLNHLKVRSFFQPIQGWGPARQMGQEMAKGKYILLADADCFYPSTWVEEMTKVLSRLGVVCVYGRYSFIPEKGFPRWKLFFWEKMKNLVAEFRHYKRPYLNAYGINLGFVKKYGLKIGFVMKKIRGEDGRMVFDLMSYGKVEQVKSKGAVAWTGPRTLQQEGTFSKALKSRVAKEFKRFFTMFYPHPPHDTKTSEN